MKAAPFEYVRAESVDHALTELAAHGGDAKLIAGGQSLVPMMAMRLARPAVLVDVNRLAELKAYEVTADSVRTGAAVRQRDIELSESMQKALPLVRDALRWVGHIQTRNRGTVGGSLVHADPSAELPLAAVVLGARVRLRSLAGGEREVGASEFFVGPMSTATEETECVVSIDWPIWSGSGVRTAFDEIAIRHGDFAMASAACQLQLDADAQCVRAALGIGGVDGVPLALPDLAQQLVGRRIRPALAAEVARACVLRCHPGSDIHADAAYRRHLAEVLLTRVILKAAEPHA